MALWLGSLPGAHNKSSDPLHVLPLLLLVPTLGVLLFGAAWLSSALLLLLW
jgi:hypothetical protein